MPRTTAAPSQAQIEKLLDILKEKPFLATGHARTAHARETTKAAWQDVATKLNRVGSGCVKTWQQWAKYWKDKKSAAKKKASQARSARLKTGGGAEETKLSKTEEKIISLTGGESCAVGDSEHESDPLNELTDVLKQELESNAPPNEQNMSEQDQSETENRTSGSESFLQDEQPGPSWRGDSDQLGEARSPPPLGPQRRRVLTARRRRNITHSPPSQRRPQMASLTERFIAIEENRIRNENILIENQSKMFDVFIEISRALSRQTSAIQKLCEATKSLVENKRH